MGIFTQNRFLTKLILVFGVTLKQITVDTWHVDWMSILEFSIHQIFSKYYDLFWAFNGHFQFPIF